MPVYESPCDVFDAGACGTADENGSYIDAWSSLSCMDVCEALDTSDPHPIVACGPVHPATGTDEHAGFVVVTLHLRRDEQPMKKLLVLIAVLSTACTESVREVIDVPTYTSPCTIGATCPNGSDLDATHDHTDEWQNLTCQDACRLLLQDRPGFEGVLDCEPMRRQDGQYKLTCDYEYDPDDDDSGT